MSARAHHPDKQRLVPAAPATSRRDRLTLASLVVCGLGIAVAGYLTIVHYTSLDPVCSGSCERVQTSAYASALGIPVALLGLLGYLALLAALVTPGDTGRLAAAGIAAAGAAYSVYLTIVSITEIEATCPWCVTSAALMVTLAALTAARWLRSEGQR